MLLIIFKTQNKRNNLYILHNTTNIDINLDNLNNIRSVILYFNNVCSIINFCNDEKEIGLNNFPRIQYSNITQRKKNTT